MTRTIPRTISITEAVETLQLLQAQLAAAHEEYREALDEVADARAELRRAHSYAFINAEGAQDLRRKIADHETVLEFKQCELAEAKMWAAQSKVSIIKEQLGAMRTIVSALRAEFAAEPTGQWS